jgi:basic amino acid/polyamine antiporter, APA family
MPTPAPTSGVPKRHLSVLYIVFLAVGMVVGAGIFKSPALVAENAGSSFAIYGVWILGGLISLVGALCYGELATSYPNPGGDYYFLSKAYGARVGFLFAWARITVINTGSIALLGFVIGDYLNLVWDLGAQGPAIYAFASVIIMTCSICAAPRAVLALII